MAQPRFGWPKKRHISRIKSMVTNKFRIKINRKNKWPLLRRTWWLKPKKNERGRERLSNPHRSPPLLAYRIYEQLLVVGTDWRSEMKECVLNDPQTLQLNQHRKVQVFCMTKPEPRQWRLPASCPCALAAAAGNEAKYLSLDLPKWALKSHLQSIKRKKHGKRNRGIRTMPRAAVWTGERDRSAPLISHTILGSSQTSG